MEITSYEGRGLRREVGNVEVLIVFRSGRRKKMEPRSSGKRSEVVENGSFGRIKETGSLGWDRREIEDGCLK